MAWGTYETKPTSSGLVLYPSLGYCTYCSEAVKRVAVRFGLENNSTPEYRAYVSRMREEVVLETLID